MVAKRLVISSDDFRSCRLTNRFIVKNTVPDHVYAHIRRGFIGGFPVNLLKHCVQHREYLYITVVVDGRFSIRLQMEGVNHIHIIQIRRCRLVCQINRVAQGNIPNGEGFKFRIARLHATLVFMVKLRKAGCHLAAAGAGCGDHHQRTLCLNIIILPEAVLAHNMGNIGRVALDGVVLVYPNPKALQLLFIRNRACLSTELRQHNAAYIQPIATERINQPQHIRIIGNAKVSSDLVLLNITCTDNKHNFRLVLQLHQHIDFAVRFKAGQNTRCMVIIKQFSAEFQIELSAELADTLFDSL